MKPGHRADQHESSGTIILTGKIEADTKLKQSGFFCPVSEQIQTHIMNIQTYRAGKMLWLLAVSLALGLGPGEISAQTAAPKPATNSVASVKFRLKATGAASVRVTGGSRGTGDAAVTLDVLAPDDVGTTTQEQPSLFWYQSKPSDAKFELTLLQPNKVKPLMQVKMDRAGKAGIQRLKLSDHGVKLERDVEYQWVVALITDPDNRSTDLVASGAIKRVASDAALQEKISQAAPVALPGIYAEAGIWYDALAVLSDQIEAQPVNAALRQTRADLFRQVGLKAPAQAEDAR
jgi:hypothetical protein